jgi:hypothetical protein
MANYYQLIARAVAGLGKNTDEVRRAALYAHARGTLVIELCSVIPPLSEPEITHECLLFEEAIRKIEATLTPSSPTATVRATLPSSPEHPHHEPLIGSPINDRGASLEAYIPNSNSIRKIEATLAPSSPTATGHGALPSGPEHPHHEPLIGSPINDRGASLEAYIPNSNSIRKIEATLTPSSPTATGHAALPSGPEHPHHEPLIGSPINDREASLEAYIPNSNRFGAVKPPELSSDPWIAPCPVPLRRSGGEPSTSMGEGINGYTLEKLVADFHYGSLWEFLDLEYEACRKEFGIERRFPREVFYRAADNEFLGKVSTPAIVATLEGKVYKIYFGFTHVTEKDCLEFLRNATDHFSLKYGLPSGAREVNKEQKTVFWDRAFGHVTLETDLFWCRNAIIYRSSTDPEKKAWFARILPSRYRFR